MTSTRRLDGELDAPTAMLRLEGRSAVVTGGSRGIGKAIVQRLAADGARVCFSFRERQDLAEALVRSISEAGGSVVATQAEISSGEDISNLFEVAGEAFGQPDIVVANPAVEVVKPFVDLTDEDFDRVFAVNAKGTFMTMREAARRIADDGRIVAISTGGTKMLIDHTALYLGSKAAVEQFVRSLSREVATRGITVNAVLPGFTDTDLMPDRDRLVGAQRSPFGRIGQPAEVAAAVAFLVSDDGGWVTGQRIGAGGGAF